LEYHLPSIRRTLVKAKKPAKEGGLLGPEVVSLDVRSRPERTDAKRLARR
jgi:hypothetical protein